jgi:hypothetical protein
MKTSYLPLVPLCAGALCLTAQAQPVLSVSQASCAPGQTAALDLKISGGSAVYGGCGATLVFPPGITPTQIAPGALLSGSDAEVYWQLRRRSAGPAYLALAAGAGSRPFAGANGTLLSIKVEVAAAVAAGAYLIEFAEPANAPITCARHAVSSADGLSSLAHTVSPGSLTVLAGPSQDSNFNGIPDDWEMRWFGAITNVSAATDSDGDGLNDYCEYLSGTDPLDPFSCIALFVTAPSLPSFSWYGASNAIYDVLRATDLNGVFTPLATNLPSILPITDFTDFSATGQVYFYRVLMH